MERRRIFTASRDNRIHSWTFNGAKLNDFVSHHDRVSALALSKDGATLASGGHDNNVLLWDAKSGEKQLRLDDHIDSVVDLFFGTDGRLYSVSLDHSVRVRGGQ